MDLVPDQFAAAARGPGGVTFVAGDARDRVPWRDLHADARALAGRLQGAGVAPGHHVAFLAGTSRTTVTALQAVWLAGGSVSFLQSPARGVDTAGFVTESARAIAMSGARTVLVGSPYTETGMVSALRAAVGRRSRVLTTTDLPDAAATGPHRRPALTADSTALRQLTSGSTAAAKAVSITHGNLAANLAAMRAASDHDRIHGRLVSWLPLNHDMGLISFLTLPMAHGCELVLADPTEFLSNPASWLRLVSDVGGTATAAPSFAYALAARLLRTGPRLDLSRLRCALSGGEPIDPAAVESFVGAAGEHGFRREAFAAAYGMAEATLAVAIGRSGAGLVTDVVDAAALETRRVAIPAVGGARGRPFPVIGPPVPDMRLRVVDPESRAVLVEREVGEIEIAGPSVTAGYHGDPAADRAAFRDGWFATGDLGYLVGGELVVCGRRKDVVILAGRNVFPEDVERAAGAAPGVRPGNVAAVGVRRNGSERLLVVAESRAVDHETLRGDVDSRVRAAVGVSPYRVLVVPPGSLPKTTSGKLRRAETARLVAAGAFETAVPE